MSQTAWVLISAMAVLIGGGTVFFHFVEGWSWVDSYFFTVVTLSTVGYGALVPTTTIGKLATTLFIFSGLGIFAVAVQQFGSHMVKRRLKRIEAQRKRQQAQTDKK